MQIEFEGKRILLDPAGGTDNVAALFAAGTYEEPLPRVFAATVRRWPGLILDVGANNGLYSLLACSAHPKVSTRAFEPFPPVLAVLRRNLALNGLERRVTVEPLALSETAGTTTLYIPSDAHGLLETSCSLEEGFLPAAATAEVRIERLDDVIGRAVPTVMKVDIEGHEPACLRGARATIEKHRPVIFYEVLGDAPERERALTEFKNSVGYLDYRLRPKAAILTDEVWFDVGWNHAMVPAEKDDAFRDVIAECGLRWVRQT